VAETGVAMKKRGAAIQWLEPLHWPAGHNQPQFPYAILLFRIDLTIVEELFLNFGFPVQRLK
jgi:hypothetical protein